MTASLPSFEITRREPPTVELTRKMLDYLLSSAFAPGQRLPSERQLAEALGVGRSAVRETIKSLTLLGLIEQRQGDGTYLTGHSSDLLPRVIEWGLLLGEQRVQDLVEARHHIEVTLAGLAAERRTPAQLDRMRDQIKAMRGARDDYARYVEYDVAFHLEIANASGNTVLSGILGNIQSLLHAWANRVISAAKETKTSLAMHVAILKAIEASDVTAAREAMTAHMVRAERRLNETLVSSDSARDAVR